jgi:GrpB-like predicted nucleotidyltransferase (UPF0157 family)/GNAT superfamily N-acetyltransferase
MKRIIEVVPYNAEWPTQFATEALKIQQILGSNCLTVHHIGSTSIPNLSAKPIIDIIPVVHDIMDVNISGLEALGYLYRGERGMPFRKYVYKGEPQHTHHLHIWEQDNPEIDKHVLFRDYLISHEEERLQYAHIKIDLAKNFKHEQFSYTTSKDYFIKNIIKKSGFNGLTIVQALHPNEWQEYHRIRKTEIFDHLPHITYDPNHPTMIDPKHYHFILMRGVDVVIEMLAQQTAALRTLATDQRYQRQGYGAHMLKLMERWVKLQGKARILMHANLKAEKFYRKRGYIDMFFDDLSIDKKSVDLGKIL